ncbi:hypothetical protein KC726_00830 [Candidatus Woesebacteria bacterium]|nr:hypothetical protein [Candidatus Woesebacteria bacterium]
MIILLSKPATDEDIQNASVHYPNYIKITIDIEKELIAIGGEYHADAEKILLENGGNSDYIWGGGLDLITGEIETNAIVNIKPKRGNRSTELLEEKTRNTFISIAKQFLTNHAK